MECGWPIAAAYKKHLNLSFFCKINLQRKYYLFVLAKWELILKLFQNSLSCLYDDPKYTFGATLAKIGLFSGVDAARTTGVDNF